MADNWFTRTFGNSGTPVPPDTATVDTPRGASGRYNTGGFLQWDEINADLQGRAGLRVFEKMWRSDADVRRALMLCFNPIVGASVTIEPYGDEDDPPTSLDRQVAAFVEWNLMEFMRPKYKAHIWTALTVAGRSGFAPFEQVYTHTQWQGRDVLAIKRLDLRLPRSVFRWPQQDGELMGIEQFAVPNAAAANVGQPVAINAKNLVYYRFGAEGDNWDGLSLIRSAYANWKYKTAIELIEAIGIEKFAIGTPVGYPPRGATVDQLNALETVLANWRANENQYLMLPGPKQEFLKDGEGWQIEILSAAQSDAAGKVLESAKQYHSDKIASVVIAEFMRQGMKNVGARATSETQQDPFLQFCETISDLIVEDTINEQLIPRLVDFNFTVPAGRYPRLKVEVIDDTSIAELSTAVAALANVGAIRVEPTLEARLRQVMDLPPADEGAIAKNEADQAQQREAMLRKGMVLGPDGKPTGIVPADPAPVPGKPARPAKPVKAMDAVPAPPNLRDAPPAASARCGTCRMYDTGRCWGYGNTPVRDGQVCDSWTKTATKTLEAAVLKPHEQHMSLDRIASAIDTARDRFQAGAGNAVTLLARDLAKTQGIVKHGPAPPDLTAAVRRELESLYRTGRQTVVEELDRQRAGGPPVSSPVSVQLAAGDLGRKGRMLAGRAQVAADQIRATVVNAVNRARMRGTSQPSVEKAAADAGSVALKDAAVVNASAAVNAGRQDQADTMTQDIHGAIYTSVLDNATCEECSAADTDTLYPLDDPGLPDAPNPGCSGEDRCRCMLAYVLADEDAPSA